MTQKCVAWYVCGCPEHDNAEVPCDGIVIYATDPNEALALAWCDIDRPQEAIVRREPLADAFTHLALGSAIPKVTWESPAEYARIYRRLGLGPIDNGKRCFLCLKAEWTMVEESKICDKCNLCQECSDEIGEGC